MNKILALDLGDAWTGVALSDSTQMFARPVTTVGTKDLVPYLETVCRSELIKKIVIGHPRTMQGGESDQTRKIVAQKEQLEKEFPNQEFILWDERLSSQRAQALAPKRRTPEDKLKIHARAAAFILDSYLTFLRGNNDYQVINIDNL